MCISQQNYTRYHWGCSEIQPADLSRNKNIFIVVVTRVNETLVLDCWAFTKGELCKERFLSNTKPTAFLHREKAHRSKNTCIVVMDNSLASRIVRGKENKWLSKLHILAGQHNQAWISAQDERIWSGPALKLISAMALCPQAYYAQCGYLKAKWSSWLLLETPPWISLWMSTVNKPDSHSGTMTALLPGVSQEIFGKGVSDVVPVQDQSGKHWTKRDLFIQLGLKRNKTDWIELLFFTDVLARVLRASETVG